MNVWRRFKNLPIGLLMLHVTAKFLGGVFVGVLLAKTLAPYMWWILIAGFVIAVPSSVWILTRGGRDTTPTPQSGAPAA